MIGVHLRRLKGGVSLLAAMILSQQGVALAQQAPSGVVVDQTIQQAPSWSGAYADPPDNTQPIDYSFWPVSMGASNNIIASTSPGATGASIARVDQSASNMLNSASVALPNGVNVVRQGAQNDLSPDDFQSITLYLASAPQNVFTSTNIVSAGYGSQVDPFANPFFAATANSRIASISGNSSGQSASNSINNLNATVSEGANASLNLQQTNRTATSYGLFDIRQAALNSADAAVYSTQNSSAAASVAALSQGSTTRMNSAVVSGASTSGTLTLSGEQSNVFDTTDVNGYITKQEIGNVATAVTTGSVNASFAPGMFLTNTSLGNGDSRVADVNQSTAVSTNTLSTNQNVSTDSGASFQQTFSDRAIETTYASNNSGGVVSTQAAKNAVTAITGSGNASLVGTNDAVAQNALYAANTLSTASGISNANIAQTGVVSGSLPGGGSENVALAHTESGAALIKNVRQNGVQVLNATEASAVSNTAVRQTGLLNVMTANDMYANSNVSGSPGLATSSNAQVQNVVQNLQVASNHLAASTLSNSNVTQQGTTDPGVGFGGINLGNNIGVVSAPGGTARATSVSQSLGSSVNSIVTPHLAASSNQNLTNASQTLNGIVQTTGGASIMSGIGQSAANSANSIKAN